MLAWHEGLIILGYIGGVILTGILLARWFKRDKDVLPDFAAYFFLRCSVIFGFTSMVGLTVLACGLFWERQALAVGISALIAMPGLVIAAAFLQWGFFRRYSNLDNMIARLEKLEPHQRNRLLESLPPDQFARLPGDYRIIS